MSLSPLELPEEELPAMLYSLALMSLIPICIIFFSRALDDLVQRRENVLSSSPSSSPFSSIDSSLPELPAEDGESSSSCCLRRLLHPRFVTLFFIFLMSCPSIHKFASFDLGFALKSLTWPVFLKGSTCPSPTSSRPNSPFFLPAIHVANFEFEMGMTSSSSSSRLPSPFWLPKSSFLFLPKLHPKASDLCW